MTLSLVITLIVTDGVHEIHPPRLLFPHSRGGDGRPDVQYPKSYVAHGSTEPLRRGTSFPSEKEHPVVDNRALRIKTNRTACGRFLPRVVPPPILAPQQKESACNRGSQFGMAKYPRRQVGSQHIGNRLPVTRLSRVDSTAPLSRDSSWVRPLWSAKSPVNSCGRG